jgi:predicted RecB family nuclease
VRLADEVLLLSPSDLSGFLACEHLTTLDLAVARGEREQAVVENDQRDLIQRKGEEHERAYLETLRAAGYSIVEIDFGGRDWAAAAAATEAALRSGVDVVYQGVVMHGRWRGVADFLMRVETPSSLGAWSYEALDTKLARHAKPSYILQLCFYNQELARVQGAWPAQIHVLLGSGEQQSFRPDEFGAYYRRVRSRVERFVDDPPLTEPWPCEHCGVCDFKPVCDAHWDEIDHLSRVAGIRRSQIDKLVVAGISTLAALGRAGGEPPRGISPEGWAKIREQAELQLWARENGRDRHVLLPHQAGVGFALLPEPSPGDLFFDFEGNPFWDKAGSLEYLWGILDAERNFTPLHADDHESERRALEQFVDIVHARLHEYPDLHVYHYASYEITALKRLMGRYGTCEDEIDALLRRGVFVDLLAVVRNGIRASRPGYGLKELEVFLDFERRAEVKDGGASIVVFERWMQTRDAELLTQIDAYNEEDCVATLLLRDWLLECKREAIERYGPIPQLEAEEPRPIPEKWIERSALQEQLFAAGQEVAAHLLEYHRREHKPVWWAFFDRIEMTPDELLEDAESISRLELVGGPQKEKRSLAYTFAYPAQEHKLGKGREVIDPATGDDAGEILRLDREQRTLVLKRGPKFKNVSLPLSLIPGGPFRTPDQEDALARFGRSLLAADHAYPALETILDRVPFDREIQTTDLDELKTLVRSLDGRHLVIQGPPGSGKTWTSGRLIADLISHHKTVGVASTSHKAIHKLLDEVEDAADEIGLEFAGLKKASSGNPESDYEHDHFVSVTSSDDCAGVDVTGGTGWHYARDAHNSTLDYLFIDEAGQVSLADALAMGTCARNVVLVGDPQQLAQVLQGTHPAGTDASVLTWLIGDAETIPPARGIFLERTFRLHPSICEYISGEFYEGRLRPDPCTAERATPLGTGLRYVEVAHAGNRQESLEEVEAVRALVDELLSAGVTAGEVMVVSPYNMQVNLLREALPAAVAVGTVDKFQGQEADVVIYSMASSSGDDVPHGLEFLLSRNRLNVAISRARCLAYLVASPRLIEVNCRTIPQMRLANALCRFVELVEIAS